MNKILVIKNKTAEQAASENFSTAIHFKNL